MLRTLIIICVICVICGSTSEARPNLIVIYTDDHGWPDIGAQGIYDDLKTPNIDALASSGVRATSGYSTAPQCVPSRAGLLSGRHQSRFGVESNGDTLEGFDAQETIAERLKKAGYATGQIGKWHLGPTDRITGHGFDDVYSKNANRPCDANYTLEGKTIPMQMVDDGLYHLDACTQAAIAFIQRHSPETRAKPADSTENREPGTLNTAKPFFLYLAYRAPHVPLDAPQKYLDRFPGEMPERRRQALAMISAVDDGVGAITADLKKRGLAENTLIFYMADNGAPLKIHKLDAPGGGAGWDGSYNAPMNGEKGMLSEGGMRVPFVVAWPGTIPGAQLYEKPLSTLDVAATAVALAGLPSDDKLDGTNLIPYLTGENKNAPHEILTWRWVAQAALREGNWKYLRGGVREYLYDLDADPGETSNLLVANPEIAERLRARLESWASELTPPGLETGAMSSTWEDYYDFYLDGKPAPLQRDKLLPGNEPGTFQGWVARNAEASVHDGALHLTPESKGNQRPFIAQAGLDLTTPFSARVTLRSEPDAKAGLSWRFEGQKDFPKNQVTGLETTATSSGLQTLEALIAGPAPVIHLRLHLHGPCAIQSIELLNASGKLLKSWNFSK